MSIRVNEATVTAALSDADNAVMQSLLQALIDEELQKEAMDTALVDACVEALLALEEGAAQTELLSREALTQFCHRNAFKKRIKLRRAALIAAVMAIAASVTLAASPTLAQQTKDLISSIMYSLGIAADATDTGDAEVVSIYAELEDAALTVKSEDDVKPEKIKVFAVTKDNCEREISISDCKVNTERIENDKVLLTISYEGCALSLVYTLEVQE